MVAPASTGLKKFTGGMLVLSVIILRLGVLPRWLGVTGLAVSTLYLLN